MSLRLYCLPHPVKIISLCIAIMTLPIATQSQDVRGSLITDTINNAEHHLKAGEQAYKVGDYILARREFDVAVDSVLISPIGIKNDNELRSYYAALIEKISRYDLISHEQKDGGFGEQRYNASPLDKLASLSEEDIIDESDNTNKLSPKQTPLRIQSHSPLPTKQFTSNGRYTNKEYGFSLQVPAGSAPDNCSGAIVCYEGAKDRFGPAASFQVRTVDIEGDAYRYLVGMMKSRKGTEAFSAIVMKVLSENHNNIHLVSTSPFTLGQVKGIKYTVSFSSEGVVLSGNIILLPVATQNRFYSLITIATPVYFNRWNSVTERAVSSFISLAQRKP